MLVLKLACLTAKVLVIGGGAREHALAWKLSQSPQVEKVYVIPGNGGTAKDGKITNVEIGVCDYSKIIAFCKENTIRLAVVGPEQPLVDGIVNMLKNVGIQAFGPSKKAAKLEASKAFSKDFMHKHGIPTACYQASGLAGGKGVLLPTNKHETIEGLKQIMVDRVFGLAGDEVVVEEYLEGPEISVFALCDGYSTVIMPTIQDHKKIGEGDTGLNTGGMGAYGPTPYETTSLMSEIRDTIINPTIRGMRRSGYPFVGVLFVGIMITKNGPKVLEYNVRFGDPEAQVLMALINDEVDLLDILEACVEGRLDSVKMTFKPSYALTVVTVTEGYPGSSQKGKNIKLGDVKGVYVFHGATKIDDNGGLVTNGGRVMAVTAVEDTLKLAQDKVYEGLKGIVYDGIYYRRDIAYQALNSIGEKPHVTYAMAGVDIDAGNRLINLIKPYCKATKRPGCDADLGGFGALFDLSAVSYKDPILVAGTDGVGTKLKIAQVLGVHNTIGQDLVAMSVNDLIVQGAEPLFFLDYYACGRLDADMAANVVKGIAEGCQLANCGLIGGETAEMPSFYQGDEYDLAGFSVGVAERSQLLPSPDIKSGDVLIGLASSGIHSNGFSLVRHLVDQSGVNYTDPAPFLAQTRGVTLGDVLLTPTRIYIQSLLPLIRTNHVKGLVHITGGGFPDNIPRILPDQISAEINTDGWPFPPVFKWLKTVGNVDNYELSRTFNCGIGMVIVASNVNSEFIIDNLTNSGEQASVIGHLVPRTGERVIMMNMDKNW